MSELSTAESIVQEVHAGMAKANNHAAGVTDVSCSRDGDSSPWTLSLVLVPDSDATVLASISVDVLIPAAYPHADDEYLFVSLKAEAPSPAAAWASDINSSTMAQPPASLSVAGLVERMVASYALRSKRAHSPAAGKSEVFSDDSDDYEFDDDGYGSSSVIEMSGYSSDGELGLGGDLDVTSEAYLEQELRVLKLKKRWRVKEDELRAAKEREEEAERRRFRARRTSREKMQEEAKQVFTSSAASGILTNDLLELMKEEAASGIVVTPIDDNIYEWSVKVSQFDESSDMAAGLRAISAAHDYDYAELRVSFVMDLHPFYPPTVSLVRPRFQAFMMSKVTCMDALKFSNWNPVVSMKAVLTQIKNLLASLGRLEVDDPRNDPIGYPEGAYSELERNLLKLETTSEVEARANIIYADQLAEFGAAALAPQVAPPDIAGPPSVTITSRDDGTPVKKRETMPVGESPLAAEPPLASPGESEMQPEATKQQYWAKGTGYGHGSGLSASWDVNAYLAAQQEKDIRMVRILDAVRDAIAVPDLPAEHVRAVTESALVPFIVLQLRNDALLDIARHDKLYTVVFDIVAAIASSPDLAPLLDLADNQTSSIFSQLTKLATMAKAFLRIVGSVASPTQTAASYAFAVRAYNTASAAGHTAPSSDEPSSDKQAGLARAILAVYEAAVEATKAVRAATRVAMDIEGGAGSSAKGKTDDESSAALPSSASEFRPLAADAQDAEAESLYAHALGELQFREGEMDMTKHHYQKMVLSMPPPSAPKILRLAQEQSSLATSLPLTLSSSVFVLVSEDRTDCMQALIMGPEDTPYASGAFLFDIAFPASYPSSNPLVNLQTTGAGSVRFNPNLYNCGKVCLSLLGTWSGAEGENWNAETSTFLQVLISIQSLILVPHPYFNEPGYERSMGTPEGDRASASYSRLRQVATIRYAMREQIESPPRGFETIIRAHFSSSSTSSSPPSEAAELRRETNALRTVLASLTMPDIEADSDDSDSDE
ncbi:uncharacterized protein AMSG_01478 [Thecamonas trahens ATCC 50062]|uniref:UBC core domain-containing protein n=1 Tax=Thecamonas trahens ATCC 50062 TaxID=461836 RepID=A0A0L0DQQ6_THETB|nr:hypothetical protein AMSG_01478 [Thecamonas trahens ATCC 50062]KNC54624.1 hypothetical protein AMSG_01478 [Thecamonas trahens ATCC 50062]|eukprot:XP_013761531.1 hypothetical protein AMSG_01478 [Thecamonas trahens ATCC 50062]